MNHRKEISMRLDTTKIKILQAKQGHSQSSLAEAAGMSRQNLNAILRRGTCGPQNLTKIAEALKIEPAEIVKED